MSTVAQEIAAVAVLRVQKRKQVAESRMVSRPLYPWQIPPPQPWDVWMMLGGRGSGKTEGGARYVNDHASGPPCLTDGRAPHRIAVVAPSHDDAVDTCVRGETGLLYVNPGIKFRPGSALHADLTWANGAEAELFGAFTPEDVERFRGPQHCLVWAEEFTTWRKLDEAWEQIAFGLRLGPHPHAVIGTTPKRRALVKSLASDPDTKVTKGRTAEAYGLPEDRKAKLYARYGGTTMGRQELDAELIEDVDGALWNRNIIVYRPPGLRMNTETNQLIPDMARIVVGVDPNVSDGNDEAGIVVAGLGNDGKGYTLADYSTDGGPNVWAARAVKAYHETSADRIVAEANNGGDLVATVIRIIDKDIPVELVHASRGKRTRAEPVAALYEQGKWIHAEPFPELEDQQCSYVGAPGEDSPDRMDALVWAASELFNIKVEGGVWGGGGVWGA
jgi:phage terminase large subunit-like protein